MLKYKYCAICIYLLISRKEQAYIETSSLDIYFTSKCSGYLSRSFFAILPVSTSPTFSFIMVLGNSDDVMSSPMLAGQVVDTHGYTAELLDNNQDGETASETHRFPKEVVLSYLRAFYEYFIKRLSKDPQELKGVVDPIPAAALLCVDLAPPHICPFGGWACAKNSGHRSRQDFLHHLQLHFTRSHRPSQGRRTDTKAKFLCLFCGAAISREDALRRHVDENCRWLPRAGVNDRVIHEALLLLVLSAEPDLDSCLDQIPREAE
ncbi:hypothetical protein OBBRIDRAFT_327589 [Obba rivulosa]|uniref:Uncharacterized protein n=1 Tax=Obba rivulosa TaxID=1052685 RepID=A0A8E2J4T1_9APHY|nr:hypothetical protein OBBRIDRAFT_327589 [Obba rivulosa]